MSTEEKKLTPKQEQALEEMRKRFPESKSQSEKFPLADHCFLRYLQARDWKVEAATKQLQATLDWRESFQVDKLEMKNSEIQARLAMEHNLVQVALGQTASGDPLYMELTGGLHVDLFHQQWRDEDTSLTHVAELEHLFSPHRFQKKMVSVMDLKGLTMRFSYLLHFLQALTDIDAAHYPETLKTIYVTNAPAAFPAIWTMIKVFLDAQIASRVRIFSPGVEETLITEVFGSVENMPVEFGGQKTGTFVPLPDLKTAQTNLASRSAQLDLKTVSIAAGASEEVELEVDGSADTTFQWYYAPEGYDLGLSVTFVEGTSVTNVRGFKKVAHPSLDWGIYSVPAGKVGKLVLKFDNTHSWMRSKTARYALCTTAFNADHLHQLNTYHPYAWSHMQEGTQE
jgi:hypothetical protein